MVSVELQIRKFKQEGYEFRLISNDSRISRNGRVKLNDSSELLEFAVEITKGIQKEIINFKTSM